ncbi:E set domain-containing protein [Kockovaella imperatae]|uniref:Rho GDP-dissociation inhibitor n=1 Tax=Kockovaella imperatae TaxID=4999 RepID=A0A1Y1UK40_9TREE|nr:E set domain-containing protein [Kockovaella imperatae]ORX38423.1 E set domain-containing protein [Kockovaella imperatae]
MSQAQDNVDDEFAPTQTQGYKVGESKTVAELAALDQEDESLQRWKQSLGIATGPGGSNGPKQIIPKTLFLSSPTLSKPVSIEFDKSKDAKSHPVTIKEGVEYSVGITFLVQNEIVSGLKYIQVVKRAGITVDKTEAMLGSYGPQTEAYSKTFASDESPSGMLARSGTYNVRSRVVDDDNTIWLDFEWAFKLAKEW